MTKTLIAIFLFSLSTLVVAQDLEGKWHGTYTYLKTNYPVEVELTTKNDSLVGHITSEYCTMNLKGVIEDTKVNLVAYEFDGERGKCCLPKYDLQLVDLSSQLMLEGKWKPNLIKGGCVVSGKITLLKQVTQEPLVSHVTEEVDDVYSRAMVSGLAKQEYHALLIGVNDYGDDNIKDLSNPVSDIAKLKAVLTSKYNFDQEHVVTLENPKRFEILQALEALGQKLDNKDNLLIFYAGHGIWEDDVEQGYWLPADAKRNSKADWISNSTIRDYVRGIDSRHTLLIADACFSGGLLKERSVGKAMMNIYNLPSRKAITSGTLTTVPDESVFMKYFLKYLNENPDQLISADQIFYRIKVAVINNSPTNQVPQYGPIHQANDEGGEFVFLKMED